MSDLYDQIVSTRGSFERLLARIPGFQGYLDKATRRTADRLLRDYIADLLKQRIDRLVRLEQRLLNAEGGLMFMSKTTNTKTQIQLFRDRVAAAVPGYSGFMEAVKVGNEELDRLYSFDEAQIRYVDRLGEGLDALETAVDGLEADKSQTGAVNSAIAALDSIAAEANEAFLLREDVLTNLSKSLSS